MADIITVQELQNASLDAQALERFINGDDTQEVLTRLSAEYPTLRKAIKTMFENGGLPATPFKTKALMEASALEDGAYAVVTEDKENNGLYVKSGGIWSKSEYDLADLISAQVNTKTDKSLERLLKKSRNLFDTDLYIKAFIGYKGDQYTPGVTTLHVFKPTDGYTGSSLVIKLKPNTTYTLKIKDVPLASRVRIVGFVGEPIFLTSFTQISANNAGATYVFSSDTKASHTFTTNSTHTTVVINTTSKAESKPRAQLNEGEVAFEYEPVWYIADELIKRDATLEQLDNITFKKSGNLFDKYYTYSFGWYPVQGIKTYGLWRYYDASVVGSCVVIPCKASTDYAIKIHGNDTSELLRVGTSPIENLQPAANPSSDFASQLITPLVDSNSREAVVTTPENAKTLIVYTSNKGSNPRVMIVEGSEPVDYKSNIVVASESLEQAKGVGQRDKVKFSFFADLDTLWTTAPISEYPENVEKITVEQFHSMMAELVDTYPQYIKSRYLGDGEGDYRVFRYDTIPVRARKMGAETWSDTDSRNRDMPVPKIMISASVHGREKTGSFVVYYMLKRMFENAESDPRLDFFLRNVHLIIIPCLSGSAWTDGESWDLPTGGNINRDFLPDGKEQFKETRLLAREIDADSDMNFHLDFHNSPWTPNRTVGYTLTDNEFMGRLSVNMYNELGRSWKRRFNMPQDIHHEFGYSSVVFPGSSNKYSSWKHGIPSACFEVLWTLPYVKGGNPRHSEPTTHFGLEALVNMLTGCVKSISY